MGPVTDLKKAIKDDNAKWVQERFDQILYNQLALIMTPKQQYDALVQYIYAKIEAKDWHAVRDTVVDIELLVAKHSYLEVEC